jgi:NADH-quinone oxidoreductase subunit L
MTAYSQLFALLLLPLLAAGSIALFFRRSPKVAVGISMASAGLCALIAFMLLLGLQPEGIHVAFRWFEIGDLRVELGFLLNSTSGVLLLVVTLVGFLIHLFAVGYSDHDESRARFFGGLSLFMFSMTGIVLASNLVMLFVFWELVGLSSYLLIGHYQYKKSAAMAANKAFIVNRVGDFGFLIGIIWCWWLYGTTDLAALQLSGQLSEQTWATAIGLLLFCGVLGKSAQMPLHVWLPDAMEGPTPVSALIHAATMVAAGVFLMCRVFFMFTPDALEVISWVGAITAIYAGICAITQRDIKKILAYSTLSQLGFMVAAFALGTMASSGGHDYGVGTSLFHLTTHAFFKALLFLGAGSIIYATHHEQDIYNMGGLYARMPWTFATFGIGVLALCGIPLLSGFSSKEAILAVAFVTNKPIFVLLMIGAGITAFYMTRLTITVFWGTPRTEHVGEAKENQWVMILPLVVLALLSIVGWMEWIYPKSLHPVLVDSVFHPKGDLAQWLPIASIAVAVISILLAWRIYKPGSSTDPFAAKGGFLFRLVDGKLWFDEIYRFYINKIQQPVAETVAMLDLVLIAGLGMRGSAGGVGLVGLIIRFFTTGNVQHYLYWFAVGIILCAAWILGTR